MCITETIKALTNLTFWSNNTLFLDCDDPNKDYDFLTTKFQEAVNKHAPLKKKILWGNHALFIVKEFRKAIYTRSRLRNKFLKTPHQSKWVIVWKAAEKMCLAKKEMHQKLFQ